ncbi:isocitrate lyase/PEP mutase family protein [Jatrophihabitans sp. DSM 45814]
MAISSEMPDLYQRFLELHNGDHVLLLPNPWDAGSAAVLKWLGFEALATTSSGFASSLGRLDGSVTKAEALDHAASIVRASDLPVSADLENGFGHQPEEVADTVVAAADVGLAGCSIEDYSGSDDAPIYEFALAMDRIVAAASAAHAGPHQVLLTARAENYLHGRPDLDDTIQRLQAFQEAGADVLYAPGVTAPADILSIVSSVDRPVNVLLLPHGPGVAELSDLGVRRISVGGAFAYAAMAGMIGAARELQAGTTGFWSQVAEGRDAARAAFTR